MAAALARGKRPCANLAGPRPGQAQHPMARRLAAARHAPAPGAGRPPTASVWPRHGRVAVAFAPDSDGRHAANLAGQGTGPGPASAGRRPNRCALAAAAPSGRCTERPMARTLARAMASSAAAMDLGGQHRPSATASPRRLAMGGPLWRGAVVGQHLAACRPQPRPSLAQGGTRRLDAFGRALAPTAPVGRGR